MQFNFQATFNQTNQKKDEKKEKSTPGAGSDGMAKLQFGVQDSDKKKSEKGGLSFDTGKSAGNPFSGESKSKGSTFSFGGGAKGIEVYAPKGSEIDKFLNNKLASGGAKSTSVTRKFSQGPKLRSEITKTHEIKEIEMSGVAFERIFSMPEREGQTGNMGEMFRRRINVDVQ